MGVVLMHPNFNQGGISPKTKDTFEQYETLKLVAHHPITDNLSGISNCMRALTIEEKAVVGDLVSSGTGTGFRSGPYLWDKQKNSIDYNKGKYTTKKVVSRAEFFDGRLPIQALYDEICAGEFILNVMVGIQNGALSGLFSFCHEKSSRTCKAIQYCIDNGLHLQDK
ncbi:hypothetical protein BASA60_001987 [Batrachochytrium salamandrivorans]|nr:hypothetical protein BASA60_001987 [Batrachochytrium salamandrivorans]